MKKWIDLLLDKKERRRKHHEDVRFDRRKPFSCLHKSKSASFARLSQCRYSLVINWMRWGASSSVAALKVFAGICRQSKTSRHIYNARNYHNIIGNCHDTSSWLRRPCHFDRRALHAVAVASFVFDLHSNRRYENAFEVFVPSNSIKTFAVRLAWTILDYFF